MRIGELSRRSGVSVPTIKFYLREGLLPPGELTSPNQADYADAHLRRLRLIRALIDLAGLPVVRVKEVLESLDSDDQALHHRIGAVHRALAPPRQPAEDDGARAEAQVRELIEKRGWTIEPDAPAIGTLAETIAALYALGQGDLAADLDSYADAVERLAEREVAAVASRPDTDRIAESVVVGTIVGERLITALRLLAQEHVSARLLGSAPGDSQSE
ncbi:MerR family transcriptional regulator [Actinoallomurus soli]|uniref:MerR family transcriptional regulator n=1 Tax=Actinoallomurus soli TaxID=2952535 RepID=UPI0020929445|nr:MerR family transcriptional regulator [Actinoallomurus soli]MCO5968167.1 MerR family transcriptional regulator [Actinoallomurus soli]